MIASFLEGIEHSLDDKQFSSLAGRLSGWSGSDIQVCLSEKKCSTVFYKLQWVQTNGERKRTYTKPPCCPERFGR